MPWCDTCGKDIIAVPNATECSVCETWWAENPPPEPLPTLTPTPDQLAALSAMTTWLSETDFKKAGDDDRFFLLQGYAGTGKSFAISSLPSRAGISPSDLCFTAPTNKAVKVLRNYLDEQGLKSSETRTIYSLLGLSLQANGEVKELSKPDEPVDLSRYRVIIVDEASMVNRFLMSAIHDAFDQWHVPFIFMGDPAQLPPVGESHSPVFKLPNSVVLTKVLRYGNSILDLATSIRLVVDHPFPSIKISTSPPVYRLSKPEWMDRIFDNLDLIKSGDARIIAWRNVTVDKYNHMVREKIFGRSESKSLWLPGDKIIAKSPLKDLSDETFMQTAEEAEIEEIAIGHHPRFGEFEIFNLLCRHETGRKYTLRVLTPTGSFAVNNKLNELSMEAKSGKRYKWREFWTLKEAFHDIRHSYAMTSHMSQGSSFIKTFIDLEDILLNRNRSEAFRALYVAATRSREEVYFA